MLCYFSFDILLFHYCVRSDRQLREVRDKLVSDICMLYCSSVGST
jgi:hypothetical protein